MKRRFSTMQLVRIAVLAVLLYVAQVGLSMIPNVELVSLLIMCYTIVFGKETFFAILVFNLFEGLQWGFGMWWFSYLYTWPILCLVTLLLKRIIKEEFAMYAVVSGIYGLLFGSFFAIAYISIDWSYALTYWIAGLPWDVWHAITNFIVMLILGKPIYQLLKYIKKSQTWEQTI